jgi:hypothetical protein
MGYSLGKSGRRFQMNVPDGSLVVGCFQNPIHAVPSSATA